MRLFFARHGESQANLKNVISNRDLPHPLTTNGRGQALALAERLDETGISAIYASPVPRAYETAKIVSERLGIPLCHENALREIDCGVMEGRGDSQAWRAYHEMLRRWDEHGDHDYRIDGGESLNEVKLRFGSFINQLPAASAETDDAYLLVSHGNVLQQMLPLILNGLEPKDLQAEPLGTCAYVSAVKMEGGLVFAGRS